MRDIIIMIGFLGLLPLCFSRPFVGILVGTWFAVMYPQREAYGFSVTFQFNMIITAVTLISLFAASEKITPVKNFTIYLMFTFFAWTIITCFTAIDPVTSWDFFNLTPLKVYVYIFTLILLVDREERLLALLWIIVISLGYYGASIGIVGLRSGGGNLGLAENFGPVGTMIQDRNHMVVALLMMFPILLYFHKYTSNKMIRQSIKCVAVLTLITVLVSYSRTGLLCLGLIGGYYFMFLRNKVIILIGGLIVFMVSFMFMPPEWQKRMSFSSDEIKSEGSLDIRLNAWNLAQTIASDHPITGGGFRIVQNPVSMAMYPGVSKNPYAAAAHSIYFEVLSDHGYIGLLLFLTLLLNVSYINFATRRMTKNLIEYQWIFDLATALQLAIFVYALGGAALSLAYYDVFYIIAFLSALLHDMVKQKIPNTTRHKTKRRFTSIVNSKN
jgi:putative inorganic carbon (hco3(-)) transporter